MNNSKKQKGGENSTNIQAENLHVGMSFGEVEKIVYLLLKENFPTLKKEAAEEAQKNVQKYLEKLNDEFKKNLKKIDIQKFANPEIQYDLNEAVTGSARRGEKADLEILAKLVIEKVSIKSTDIMSLTISEAISVLPKLTKNQIDFISFVQYARYFKFEEVRDLKDLELKNILLMKLSDSFYVSDAEKKYLQYTGILYELNIMSNDYFKTCKENYPILKDINIEQVKVEAPNFYNVIELYKTLKVPQINLSAVGQLIALINLKKVFNLDYNIWIN